VRAELERKLAEIVLPHLIGARVVAAYHPLKDEISPYPILERLVPDSRRPCPGSGTATPDDLAQAPAVEPSPWGVLQPSGDAPGAGARPGAGAAGFGRPRTAPASVTARVIMIAPCPTCATEACR
jgi:hypothetical protein